jgi:hypothetical protein
MRSRVWYARNAAGVRVSQVTLHYLAETIPYIDGCSSRASRQGRAYAAAWVGPREFGPDWRLGLLAGVGLNTEMAALAGVSRGASETIIRGNHLPQIR